jgi:uncharacterized protein (DUF2225 family)
MTTLSPLSLTCPCCEQEFQTQTLGSTNSFGPLTTDLYKMAGGMDPLPYFVHTCNQCGFSGYEDDFEEPITDDIREKVLTQIKPEIKNTCSLYRLNKGENVYCLLSEAFRFSEADRISMSCPISCSI